MKEQPMKDETAEARFSVVELSRATEQLSAIHSAIDGLKPQATWTIDALKTYVDTLRDSDSKAVAAALAAAEKAVVAALAASEKAIDKAEEAQQKRNEVSNEFRQSLSDLSALMLPRIEFDAIHKSLLQTDYEIKEALGGVRTDLTALSVEGRVTQRLEAEGRSTNQWGASTLVAGCAAATAVAALLVSILR